MKRTATLAYAQKSIALTTFKGKMEEISLV